MVVMMRVVLFAVVFSTISDVTGGGGLDSTMPE